MRGVGETVCVCVSVGIGVGVRKFGGKKESHRVSVSRGECVIVCVFLCQRERVCVCVRVCKRE